MSKDVKNILLIFMGFVGLLLFVAGTYFPFIFESQQPAALSFESINNNTKWCINGWAYNMKDDGQLENATYTTENYKDSSNPVPIFHARCGVE
ncbi:hypothetical protein FZT94_22060 [Salmonella enterica subsp. enterica]|nr:hypothetical protein [Salmonella enterica subsp. enterica serovar Newport]